MQRPRIVETQWPAVVYAIGDVHGCLDQLVALEATIFEDAKAFEGEKWLIMLGDYIDRGPNSAGVIEQVLKPLPEGWRRICLMGNHEQFQLDFLAQPLENAPWLGQGGFQTLQSYGVELDRPETERELIYALHAEARQKIPPGHVRFVSDLAVAVSLPGWLFVHAGIRPGLPLDQQSDRDLIWIREPFLSTWRDDGLRVVHGHTPAEEPVVRPYRIGIDTWCFHTGRLTAVRVTPDGEAELFSATA